MKRRSRASSSAFRGSGRPVAASGQPRLGVDPESDAPAATGRPLPRNAEELARDLRFIQMELLMSAEADGVDGDRSDEDEDGA